jgi:dTDP-4-amino-4,6-dideoxygalactose transaminase
MSPNTDFIPFARPLLGPEEEEAAIRVMRSGWMTTGAEALAFEREFAAFVGSPRALAVNSATSGLHLALEALGVGPGDTVITSPYTFTSSAAVARHLGAELRFCDVAPGSYNMDPEALARALEAAKNCKAVVLPHIGGLPARTAEIKALADRYGCALVEDAAHAFPSATKDGYAGTLGRVGVYSFYATKTITTGEGGMVVTADAELAARMALMRMHGIDREVWDRYTSKKASWSYQVTEAGYKYNLPDILAAIGRVQLRRAESFLEMRRAIAARYDRAFAAVPGFILPPRGEGHAWHLYALRLDEGALGVGRDEFIERMAGLGVGCSVHFIPLHIMPYYAERYGLKPEDFPEAYAMYCASASLPIWQGMDEAQAEKVIQAALAVAARP